MLHLGSINSELNNNLDFHRVRPADAKKPENSAYAGFFDILKSQVQTTVQGSGNLFEGTEMPKDTRPASTEMEKPRTEAVQRETRNDEPARTDEKKADAGNKVEQQNHQKETRPLEHGASAEVKKQVDDRQRAGAAVKDADAATRSRQKRKAQKSEERELHNIHEGLNRILDVIRPKEDPEIRSIKHSIQELRDRLQNARQNQDIKPVNGLLDKLAAAIDGLRKAMAAAQADSGTISGVKKTVSGMLHSGGDRKRDHKMVPASDIGSSSMKDLLVKIESMIESLKGDGTRPRNDGQERGSGDMFNFGTVKNDSFTRHGDAAAARQGNTLFRENLESVIQNARVVVKDGQNGSFTVRLYPRELGSVNISLGLTDGVVNGTFMVNTAEAKEQLLNNIEYIKQQLSDAGIQVGEFNVNVNDQRGWRASEQKDDVAASLSKAEGPVEIESEYAANTRPYHDGRIDLVI